MTIRPIIQFPSQLLRTACAPVIAFDGKLQRLAGDLLDTMRAAPGVGITGPHIGELVRIVVIELPEMNEPHFYVNARVVWHSDERASATEGSVSMPGITEQIERASSIKVDYQDLQGNAQTVNANGFLAACLQHEIDQLDGIFWLQRLSRLKRERLIKRYEKQRPSR